ncbi:hypothetical protein AZE42_11060 [Rhizopogon vesiculosus]|uniref:Uncharacterized protein n=1 Tax=Rhizopogon vesiculosus TaxID=180088 RepID=A0A1J8PXC4_9AGAM|nr:hypothetical protein AZE42_11060 [Rhizopogon vesiculosus]
MRGIPAESGKFLLNVTTIQPQSHCNSPRNRDVMDANQMTEDQLAQLLAQKKEKHLWDEEAAWKKAEEERKRLEGEEKQRAIEVMRKRLAEQKEAPARELVAPLFDWFHMRLLQGGMGKKRARASEKSPPKRKHKQRRQRDPSPKSDDVGPSHHMISTELGEQEYDNQAWMKAVNDMVSELATMNTSLQWMIINQQD